MNKETLLKQIEILLETTLEQYSQIHAAHGRIPQIEIDLVLANLRQTYEFVSMLDYVNKNGESETASAVATPEVKSTVTAPVLDGVIEEIPPVSNDFKNPDATELSDAHKEENIAVAIQKLAEVENITEEATTMSDDIVEKQVVEINIVESETPIQEREEAPKVEMTSDMVKEFLSMNTTPVSAPVSSAPTQTASLFDDLPPTPKPVRGNTVSESIPLDESPSFHDKITREKLEDNSLVEKLQKKRIADLKSAIGINEKFLFINELFEGNLSLYNEGIDKINSFDSVEDAKKYVHAELRPKYNWTNAPKADKMLMELIERRFTI